MFSMRLKVCVCVCCIHNLHQIDIKFIHSKWCLVEEAPGKLVPQGIEPENLYVEQLASAGLPNAHGL